ncbi:unnamed protein product, partial [Prorocentrum cordatum]
AGAKLPSRTLRPGSLANRVSQARAAPTQVRVQQCLRDPARPDRPGFAWNQARRRELVRRSRRNGRPPAAGAAARSSAMGRRRKKRHKHKLLAFRVDFLDPRLAPLAAPPLARSARQGVGSSGPKNPRGAPEVYVIYGVSLSSQGPP